MNLLIIRPEEVRAPGLARIGGARAAHLLGTLGLGPGDSLRVGLPDGPRGFGRIEAIEGTGVLLGHELDPLQGSADPEALFDVLLALPRPKVLARLLRDLAALGVGRILVCRSYRVEKSYFQCEHLRPERSRELLLQGLEQGVATRVPELVVEPLFRPFVEDRLDALAPRRRLLAEPGAATGAEALRLDRDERFMLAIGPEGGFIPFERELLEKIGFEPFALGPRILRVEAALLVALGALARARC